MHLLITAGPTREPIDAVRFLSNRSSGRLGLALTRAALDAGHTVTLLLGPIEHASANEPLPQAARIERFETTRELKALLDAHFPVCDVLIMAAAVTDYRPTHRHEGKLPRGEPGETQTLELEPTPDLIGELASQKQPNQRTIAFALEEPDQLESRMRDKLRRKGADAIVGNPLVTMGSDRIAMHFHPAAGEAAQSGSLPKTEAARWLIARIGELAADAPARST